MHYMMQCTSRKYHKDGFLADHYRVVELAGDVIEVVLDKAKWTKVMGGQWEIQSPKPKVSQNYTCPCIA